MIKWDLPAVNSRTDRTLLRVKVQKEWLNRIKRDPQLLERTRQQECKVCYYTSRICGQGFTKFDCGICGTEEMWSNTCIPLLCLSCAIKERLCRRCGADLNLEVRPTV